MSQLFSEGFGPRGYRVRIYERYSRSMIHFEHRDPTAPRGVRRFAKGSLEHRDKVKARAWALRRSDELRAGYDLGHQPATASHVFARYLRFRSVDKAEASNKSDHRCAKMWTRILQGRDLHALDTGTWERFRRERSNGTIDANGKRIPPLKRVAVTNRTI